MTQNTTQKPVKYALFALSMFFQIIPVGCISLPIGPQLVEQSENFEGQIDFSTERMTPFSLEGTEPHFGDYIANGEVLFKPGTELGKLIGEGVAVFENPDGDLLVAEVTWTVDAEESDQRASDIRFSWRDSVEFSDGRIVSSTGKFADPEDRPPGLVVIAIIAILIGMLLPAVQKVR